MFQVGPSGAFRFQNFPAGYSRLASGEYDLLGGRPYTFTVKRYTFTYTKARIEFDHEKYSADFIGRNN